MAERDGDKIENEETKHAALAALPAVESPPLLPAGASADDSVEAEANANAQASVETAGVGDAIFSRAEDVQAETVVAESAAPRPWFRLSRRDQRRLTLAAGVALVAGLGALFGGALSNGLAVRDRVDVASLQQREAMQQSINRLVKQVSELKTKLAAVTTDSRVVSEVATNSASAGGASNADITGSIPAAIPAHGVPVPLPRPAPRIAMAFSRPLVVHDWHILRARGGRVDVVGRGNIYEVVPGAVLPGLGPVQSIERRNGRWIVVTPKGIIVSARDRRYFKDF